MWSRGARRPAWVVLCCLPVVPAAAAPRPQVAAPASSAVATDDPATVFRRGQQELRSGELAQAEASFRRVLALDPGSGAAYVNLGVVMMRRKRWDDALAALRKADALAPGQPGVHLNIGLAYYRKSDFHAAIGPFAEALRLAPDSAQARYLLGLCYFFTNKFREAAEEMLPLWPQESSRLNYLYVLSIAAGKSANPALEKQAMDRMLAVGQGTPEFHLYIGKAYLAQDNTDAALKEFQAAVAAKPDLPLGHYFLGRVYLETRSYERAEAELRQDIAIEPEFAYDYESLGMLHARLDQTEQAERDFREALARNPDLVNSWFGLAKLCRDGRRYREALEALDRAEALAPQSASVHYLRGQMLARLGQAAKAREEFDASSRLLKSFNDRLQQDPLGERSADAQDAAQQ